MSRMLPSRVCIYESRRVGDPLQQRGDGLRAAQGAEVLRHPGQIHVQAGELLAEVIVEIPREPGALRLPQRFQVGHERPELGVGLLHLRFGRRALGDFVMQGGGALLEALFEGCQALRIHEGVIPGMQERLAQCRQQTAIHP
jgi:hypothetical protein